MKIAMVASMLGLAIGGWALAQEHPEHPKKDKKEKPIAKMIEATVSGQNFCLGCTLKKEKGADAQCSKYGHRHALKVASATAAGKDLPDMKGWVLHYLDTDHGQSYIKENHDEKLILKGKVYTEERVLEVAKQEEKKSEHPEHPKKPN